ncbi:DoxX family protein [Mucilaginibacter aquariorum]|uniref:DoxX family protein n=1 Tax=Mucilaginibacter aquariorum TaxID=2967225 RepID=A0ABT1SXF0_9SPHI|nr:DoxX family protein [Mucilaginibacter aquariorum]MCQ6957032.1 DoxX family protein [Mucilaginibacter aquariorum]
MNIINKVENWGDVHHPKILDLIRVLLGAALISKAWIMLEKFPYIKDLLITETRMEVSASAIALILNCAIYSYFIGGALILLGLQTRAAALIGMPVTVASIFFVNILAPFMNAEISIVALQIALLFQFVIIGSGPLSLDRFTDSMKFSDKYNP